MAPRILLVAWSFICLAQVSSAERDAAAAKPDPRIKVVLRFSIDELDPVQPGDSYLECLVHNGSEKPIETPTIYVAGFKDADMLLLGGPLRLVHWAGNKEQKFARLEPGEKRLVFKADLERLLVLDLKEHRKPLRPQEPRFYWSWDR